MQHKRPLTIGDVIITRSDTSKPSIVIDIADSPFAGEERAILYCEENGAACYACMESQIRYRIGTTLRTKLTMGAFVFHTKLKRMLRVASREQHMRPRSYNANGQLKTRPYQTEKTFLLRDPFDPDFKPCTASEQLLIPLQIPPQVLSRWEQHNKQTNRLKIIFGPCVLGKI